MATAQDLGIKAPSGGFSDLGWYPGSGGGSYQYYQGSFHNVSGAIHPNSPQVGAGQKVSDEVNAQSAAAQGVTTQQFNDFINAGKTAPAPASSEAMPSYLNDFQMEALKGSSTIPEVKVPTMQEIKTAVKPTTELPALLNRNEELTKLRTQYGVGDLESQLNDLKASEREIQGALDLQRSTEKGKTVAMSVIQGRISEEEQQAMTRLDQITRQKATVVDQLNTTYGVINTYISNLGLDYKDAVDRYNTELDTNLKMYDVILGQQKEARTAAQEAQKVASANLSMMMNAITSGNMDYASLPAESKLMISKLEMQSGLPVGFMQTIKKDPKSDIIFTNSNNGVTQVGIRNADGTISVQSYGTPNSGGGSLEGSKQALMNDAADTKPYNAGGVSIGIFPQLVQKYAPYMSLQDIYRAYGASSTGQQYGTPTEDPTDIKMIYDRARGTADQSLTY